jgi:hypothetical protein
LRKATITFHFYLSVRPSFRPHWTTRLPLDGFLWNLIIDFSKIYRGNSSFIKIGQGERVLYMKTNKHFLSYTARFFIEWKMFQTNVVEKLKQHFEFRNVFFIRQSCRLWGNVEKYCRTGQTTDE